MSGTDEDENLCKLTAREHFICHLLLTKMCKDKSHRDKMIFAINMMLNKVPSMKDNRYIPNSRVFDKVRNEYAKLRGFVNKGIPKSNETKSKMSKAQKGIPKSEETKIKMSQAAKGKIVSAETRAKMSAARKGKTSWNKGISMTEETKIKISKTLKQYNT